MKKIIIITVLCFFVGGLCGFLIGWSVSSDLLAKDEVSAPIETAVPDLSVNDEKFDAELQHSITRIDYPLIDIYFEKDKTYKIVIEDFPGNVIKEYAGKGEFFQFNKEYFSILTFPSGRGTTPRYILNVYEENECIKSIECSQIRNGDLRNWKVMR